MDLTALGVAFIPGTEYCFSRRAIWTKGLQYISALAATGFSIGAVKAAQAYSAILRERGNEPATNNDQFYRKLYFDVTVVCAVFAGVSVLGAAMSTLIAYLDTASKNREEAVSTLRGREAFPIESVLPLCHMLDKHKSQCSFHLQK